MLSEKYTVKQDSGWLAQWKILAKNVLVGLPNFFQLIQPFISHLLKEEELGTYCVNSL